MNTEEKTLLSVLTTYGLRELPDEYDGELLWIRAVVLVTKRDCSRCYAYAERRDGKTQVVRDFGSSSPIYKIEKIYPFAYLSEGFIPTFKKNTKEERLAWLNRYGIEADTSHTLKELDAMILEQAVRNNLKSLKA